MNTTRFYTQPKTRRIAPDRTLLELLAPAVDADGHEWPAGTQLEPISSGRSNLRGKDEYRYTIVC